MIAECWNTEDCDFQRRLFSLPPNNSNPINQSMFIFQATTHRIFRARIAFEQGHCLQVISQAKATGCMMAHGCFSTRSAEPGKNPIWRVHTKRADNTWCRPCQGGVDNGRMRGRWRWRRWPSPHSNTPFSNIQFSFDQSAFNSDLIYPWDFFFVKWSISRTGAL